MVIRHSRDVTTLQVINQLTWMHSTSTIPPVRSRSISPSFSPSSCVNVALNIHRCNFRRISLCEKYIPREQTDPLRNAFDLTQDPRYKYIIADRCFTGWYISVLKFLEEGKLESAVSRRLSVKKKTNRLRNNRHEIRLSRNFLCFQLQI